MAKDPKLRARQAELDAAAERVGYASATFSVYLVAQAHAHACVQWVAASRAWCRHGTPPWTLRLARVCRDDV